MCWYLIWTLNRALYLHSKTWACHPNHSGIYFLNEAGAFPPKIIRKPTQQERSWNSHPSQHQKASALNMYPSQYQKAINVCQGYFCKWFNIPPHNNMYNKESSNDMHTCMLKFIALIHVYCWVQYLLFISFVQSSSLALVYACIWMKYNNAFPWPL